MFLQILMDDIITNDNAKMPFQKRELALEVIVMVRHAHTHKHALAQTRTDAHTVAPSTLSPLSS